MPTAARRNGDFSQLLTVNSSYQLYDPATGVVEGSRIRRQQFPGNIIPAARLNAVSKNFLQFLRSQQCRWRGRHEQLFQQCRALGRVFFIHGAHRLERERPAQAFPVGRYNDRVENRGNRFSNIATGNNLLRQNWGVTLDDVYTLTPTMFLNTP